MQIRLERMKETHFVQNLFRLIRSDKEVSALSLDFDPLEGKINENWIPLLH